MKALALDYRGILIHADRAAWFNATEIAEAHGKQLQKFWQREETHEYIAALCEHLNHPKTSEGLPAIHQDQTGQERRHMVASRPDGSLCPLDKPALFRVV